MADPIDCIGIVVEIVFLELMQTQPFIYLSTAYRWCSKYPHPFMQLSPLMLLKMCIIHSCVNKLQMPVFSINICLFLFPHILIPFGVAIWHVIVIAGTNCNEGAWVLGGCDVVNESIHKQCNVVPPDGDDNLSRGWKETINKNH